MQFSEAKVKNGKCSATPLDNEDEKPVLALVMIVGERWRVLCMNLERLCRMGQVVRLGCGLLQKSYHSTSYRDLAVCDQVSAGLCWEARRWNSLECAPIAWVSVAVL